MEKEYCIIYGHSDKDPGPFVLAVSDNQEMINGFREEHYHLCKGGEIVKDNMYDNYKDYHIENQCGHYMTPMMITGFCEYCRSLFNKLVEITDMIERDLSYFRFDDSDQDKIDDGFTLLLEILTDSAPVEYECELDDILNGCSVFDLPECLDNFLAIYQPDGNVF